MTIRLLIPLFLLGAHVQAQEPETTYGPWRGRWILARLSAYSPEDAIDQAYRATKGERWRDICADGRTDVRSEPYGIAAPSGIAFGTRVFIPAGYGYLDRCRSGLYERLFTVSDRGGKIGSYQNANGSIALDLRYRTEYSALAFGVKDAWVFIITN